MKKRQFAVKDIVQITGITSRTLHYYDKIGLLIPNHLTDKGYRLYDQSSLEKLQTIMFLKELDFSLKNIADILKLSRQEQIEIVKQQRQALITRKQRLETMIEAVEDYASGMAIGQLKLFDHSSTLSIQEQYANEASFLYGETDSYQEYLATMGALSPEEQQACFQSMEAVFIQLAAHIDRDPSSSEVQQLIEAWKSNLMHFMSCDDELLACIATTYKSDGRFSSYLAQYGREDFADFLYEAIMKYLNR
ncbi:MerR family transcriptional regulator [Paenibacillus daejeonensis]|uniref:MerR family transcriptional regulator n=1 Tax=Paenibacillus daejeonensis TaxID=135193 RepID=UPI00036057A1|nr:MerR family transcriptional regulator [Paenibacillus daejeonensis]